MRVVLLVLSLMSIAVSAQRKIFINGKIYTVNPTQPLAEAVVCEGEKIVFVGSSKAAQRWSDSKSSLIDLKGRLMLPGFIDNHTHFISGGFYLLGIDVRYAKSTTEFISIIKQYVASHRGQWIIGGDWDHENWERKDLPTKEMIDSISVDTPIFIQRFDGHMALANSLALKLSGIDRTTVSPLGGVIVKDPVTGEPTGILKDNAEELVFKVIPSKTELEYETATLRALQEAREKGITSIQDITNRQDLRTYQLLERKGLLTCRVYTRMPISEYKALADLGIQAGFGSSRIKMGSLKAFADGSLGSSTALFFKPYKQNPGTNGLLMDIISNGNLRKWALDADRNKLQLSIHAIGDSANYLILKLFDEIVKTNPVWDRRFRIEHAQHVRPNELPLFAKNNVIASVQPYHAIDDGVWAEKRIGDRVAYTYPFKSFLNNGILMTFGSDWTVAPISPLLGIYAATTRQTLDGKNPEGWQPTQKISVEDAIKCYTINNAYAAFEENIKGTIEVGKLADFVVLDTNIFTIAPEKIKQVKVDLTILGGEIIYQRQ